MRPEWQARRLGTIRKFIITIKCDNWRNISDVLILTFAFFLQYEKLTKLIKDFEPFKNMWLTASDWSKWHEGWMNDPLTTIDAEQLEQNVNNAFKTIFKCAKHFKEIPACQDVANEVKRKIEDFKPYIPLIQGLRNPGMRSRHWEQVNEIQLCI